MAAASAAGGDAHIMMMPDGKLAVYVPNEDAFRAALGGDGAGVDDSDVPEHLRCFICRMLLTDAVALPCCDARFCDSCVRPPLVHERRRKRRRCPSCGTAGLTPDHILPDLERRAKVTKHVKQGGAASEFVGLLFCEDSQKKTKIC